MLKTSRRISLYTAFLLLSAIGLMLLRNPYAVSAPAIGIWLRQSAILGVLSIGLMFINLCGSFDISLGAIMSLGGAACVCLLRVSWLPLPLVLLGALALTALSCLVSGLLAEWFHMPNVIVSLATMMVYVGMVPMLTDGLSIWGSAPQMYRMFQTTLLGVPLPAIVWFALLACSQFLLQKTYVGQYFYAIGDNENALSALGINTRRYKLIACLLCGLLAGVSGIFMMLRTSAATANYNLDIVFQAITVLAMSGMYQKWSRCNLVSVFFSTITMTCMHTGMTVYAVDPLLQNVIVGLVFFGALVCSRRAPQTAKAGSAA